MSIDTSSEEYRHLKEVEYVLSIPSIIARREYLDGVEKRRGYLPALKLRNDVMKAWQESKKAGNG